MKGSPVRVRASASRLLREDCAVLPDYWIERPELRVDAATRAAVDELVSLRDAAAGADRVLDLDLLLRETGVVHRWQFLCAVAERSRFAFHGTGDPHIEAFEPREPVDFAPFG